MADLVFIAVLLAFFGLAALFVSACDRIVGADELADQPAAQQASSEREAA